ncbi:hypothetical protein B0H14DRAFT_2606350 [Mycena olivaceomarginata]|nr:hypothetical protein B0H14DRAFT_2606350 [Mycena olivaceomarginata]
MAEFLVEGAAYADILWGMENLRNRGPETEPPGDSSPAATEQVSSPIHATHLQALKTQTRTALNLPAPLNRPLPLHPKLLNRPVPLHHCVEEWDNTDHSEDQLESGSDLAPYIDADGKMNMDWCDVEEFEKILEVEGEGDASDTESDDSVQSEVEREESEDDIENSSASENSDEDK